MRTRKRQHEELVRERHNNPPECGSKDNLAKLRKAGEELLASGDEAIRRALSGDSEAFLMANRQEGGQ